MKNHYVFPAIFTFEEKGVSIEFPDLPGCLPCAENEEKAFENAREALGLHLYGMEEDGEKIPEPTSVSEIKTHKNEALTLVDVFMPSFREKIRKSVVKKTLTLPYWLNAEAERKGINFSQTLQDALTERLGL